MRFQSATPNRRGRYPGVFALANGLAEEGLLAAADRQLWRQANDRVTGFYLDLLDRYDVPWVELRTSAPGPIHYEDRVQVVTTPWAYPEDWPFT